jgi:predicted PolB exonuclease-like 3'-5' exonuclease
VNEFDQKDIIIFPNPSNGEVMIENLGEITNNYKVELIDVNGNLVFTEVLQSTKLKFDLPNGLYLMKLSTKENIYFKKIIIEK